MSMQNEIISDILKKECEIANQKKSIKDLQQQIKVLRIDLKNMQDELSNLIEEAKMNGVVNVNGELLSNEQ